MDQMPYMVNCWCYVLFDIGSDSAYFTVLFGATSDTSLDNEVCFWLDSFGWQHSAYISLYTS
jgi:hypothetical protein